MTESERNDPTEHAAHAPNEPWQRPPDEPAQPPSSGTMLGPQPLRRVAVLLAVALVAAVAGSGLTLGGLAVWGDTDKAEASQPQGGDGEIRQAAAGPDDRAADGSGSMSTTEIADQLAPSVAAVSPHGAKAPGDSSAQASAVVIDSDGYLVTNHHVVEGVGPVSVTLADGSSYKAETVGTDPASDLAVLKVDATDLPAAELADEAPAVGEPVVAIGSPFGLEGSVTSGIVSALDRALPASTSVLVGLIQTDAAINPGNSGGPLVNAQGEVVGINTAIVSQSGTYSGVGFAVPSSVVSDVSRELIEDGSVERARLGIQAHTVEPRVAELYGLGTKEGVLVAGVKGDSDAAGTLRPGDVIVALNGEPVTDTAGLVSKLMEHQPGDDVTLDIVRDGDTRTVEVTLHAA